MPNLHIAQDEEADRLLSDSPLALLLGMTLDQQIPMEKAFRGPQVLRERLGQELDARVIAARADLEELFAQTPAIHRFPGSMAGRVRDLCAALVEQYDGDPTAVWEGAADGREVLKRLKALPGFGDQKARIFLALLGKQMGVQPEGWREAAGGYGEQGALASVADVTGPETLQQVRAHKQQVKAAAKAAKAKASKD